MLNLFVREHHLSSERKAVVLGVNRGQAPQPGRGEEIPLESSGREQNDSQQQQQQTLRNRSAVA